MKDDFQDIDRAVVVGVDRKGTVLHDGDRVQCFNLIAPGDTREMFLAGKNSGLPGTIRRGKKCPLYIALDDGSSTGGKHPEDARYGVEKL